MAKAMLVYAQEEVPYIPRLKKCCASLTQLAAQDDKDATVSFVAAKAKAAGLSGVFVASEKFFQDLLEYVKVPAPKGKKHSRNNYAGSLFNIMDIEFVVLPHLKQLTTTDTGEYIITRYIEKIGKRDSWFPQPEFQWSILEDSNGNAIVDAYRSAYLLSIDIETQETTVFGPIITMVGFTACWLRDGTLSAHTTVVPWNFANCTYWTNALATLPGYKTLQNGRYDVAYLARFGIAPTNWLFDTIQLQHAWHVEFPKDLAFISAFYLRDVRYWKDMATSGTPYMKMMYNALDCYGTAISTLAMLKEMPEWARYNFQLKMPMVYPSHMCEMRGIKVDYERFELAAKELEAKLELARKRLNASVGREFNANSWQQVQKLLRILGVEADSTDDATLQAVAYKDPFAGFFTEQILEIRKLVKLLGTYFKKDKHFKGRFLYALIPYGTDTGRNASGEHAFWCGQNIQNIPRGKTVKQWLVADEGFSLFECDSEQAESRDTAYLSADPALIDAVENSPDFHSQNCSAFFAVPFSEIFDVATGKVLMKPLRDLGKRVNHGANYCMGPGVLVTTMGLKMIEFARQALKLPRHWSYKMIAEHLLAQFHRTYPLIERNYYRYVRRTVATTRLLVGARGWTRECWGNVENKRTFNSYVAHGPQSENALRLDEAFLEIFIKLAIHPEHSKNFILFSQIHDSTFGQIRKGHTYLLEEVKRIMSRPTTAKGCDGVVRTYVVPAALKAGKDGAGSYRWSETE